MLRLFVLLLLLANGLYFAWSEGWLRELGVGPALQTEPQRMGQQIKPEALRILSPEEVRRWAAERFGLAGLPDFDIVPPVGKGGGDA